MKRKILFGLGGLVGVLVVGATGFVLWARANGNPRFERPATGLVASTDPAVIAEGEYLFHGPMHCTACHDASKEVAFKRKPGEKVEPIGGMTWDMGPLGRPVAANLTSDKATGLGAKSDEHIAQVLKYGIGEDGHLRTFMALAVAPVSDRETVALLSYVRTLPPKEHQVPAEEWGLMAEALVALGVFAPKTAQPPPFVAASAEPDPARGAYLANGPALCVMCHSPYDMFNGMALKGEKFSGCYAPEAGHDDPAVELCPPNLTPHETAGHITAWSEEAFLGRFKSGVYTHGDTPMPWTNFSNMTDADLRSIYRYLRTLPPNARNPGPPVRPIGTFEMPEG